ncbi:MAG: hypothetical protein IKU45_06000, partial [Clostridia bacterium]|nr:hypothetical protein [Clostridia bacterium]
MPSIVKHRDLLYNSFWHMSNSFFNIFIAFSLKYLYTLENAYVFLYDIIGDIYGKKLFCSRRGCKNRIC